MTDTLTVKDKGLRALFYGRVPGTGARCDHHIIIKLIRSQARKLASSHYKKPSRSQARKLEADQKNYFIPWHFMLELRHLKQNIRI
jgi:hypothetical protein